MQMKIILLFSMLLFTVANAHALNTFNMVGLSCDTETWPAAFGYCDAILKNDYHGNLTKLYCEGGKWNFLQAQMCSGVEPLRYCVSSWCELTSAASDDDCSSPVCLISYDTAGEQGFGYVESYAGNGMCQGMVFACPSKNYCDRANCKAVNTPEIHSANNAISRCCKPCLENEKGYCTGGGDEDCDGLIDSKDPDCAGIKCGNATDSCCSDADCASYCDGLMRYYNGQCLEVGKPCIYNNIETCDNFNGSTEDSCTPAGCVFTSIPIINVTNVSIPTNETEQNVIEYDIPETEKVTTNETRQNVTERNVTKIERKEEVKPIAPNETGQNLTKQKVTKTEDKKEIDGKVKEGEEKPETEQPEVFVTPKPDITSCPVGQIICNGVCSTPMCTTNGDAKKLLGECDETAISGIAQFNKQAGVSVQCARQGTCGATCMYVSSGLWDCPHHSFCIDANPCTVDLCQERGKLQVPGDCLHIRQTGCVLGNKCVNMGVRYGNNYCGLENKWGKQRQAEAKCTDNYECSSNFCIDGTCIDIQEEINTFQRIFGQIESIKTNVTTGTTIASKEEAQPGIINIFINLIRNLWS